MLSKRVTFFFILLFVVLYSNHLYSQKSDKNLVEIETLIDSARNNNYKIENRFLYARKAIKLSKLTKSDSIILNSNRVLSYLFLVNQDSDSLYRINKLNVKIASKLKDSLKVAFANHNLGYYFDLKKKNDSAYYHYYQARKIYAFLKERYNESDVLLNMANIQETERDYIGSEINAIRAIEITSSQQNSNDKNYKLWSLNNLIGIVSSQVNRFDKSIEYHNKALQYAEKIKDSDYDYLKWYSKINIATLYRRKKDFDKSIEILKPLINKYSLKEKDSSSYVSVFSNIAYNSFLNGSRDFKEIENDFISALKIASKIEDKVEIMNTNLFLAEFYLKMNKKDLAKRHINYGLEAAKNLRSNQDLLNALVLKSKIEEGIQSKKYLYEHIRLSDSLVLAERSIRNKFARIEFETDEIIQENIQISKQRLWLIITSIALLVTLFFLYIIKNQREKNKELQIERQQQEANQEIYNLLLTQQDKIDEVKNLEKNRISKDIHDGVLGKLFGVRLSLDSLNMSNTPEAVKKRGNYIAELKNIEEEIRKVSHELNSDFIQQSGYLNIVKTLVDTQMTAYGIGYSFDTDSNINWELLNNKIKIHVYRILQETMQNIYKHAKANKVDIVFVLDNNDLILNISDNGVGFDIQKAKKGIGLKNIDSRIQEINGKLAIDTRKEQGTTININVPAFNK